MLQRRLQFPLVNLAYHVAEPLLTRGEKLTTLERWRQNLFQQLHASGEGMRTQGYSSQQVKTLDLIEQAKEMLA